MALGWRHSKSDSLEHPEWAEINAVQHYLYYVRFNDVTGICKALLMSGEAAHLTPKERPRPQEAIGPIAERRRVDPCRELVQSRLLLWPGGDFLGAPVVYCVEHLAHVAPRCLRDSDEAYVLSRSKCFGAHEAAAALKACGDVSDALCYWSPVTTWPQGWIWHLNVDFTSLQGEQSQVSAGIHVTSRRDVLELYRDYTDNDVSQELSVHKFYETEKQMPSLLPSIFESWELRWLTTQ
ncbi:hypothetical protein D8B26_004930 [Coccidioides posadasii str. Silveira]|uniref:Predicted protein n=1 Tax=Coccidioides posadasii (strain RMSCC 757 / Silveira) TaxID=443226 RepID=E9DJA8_COCPS|nr:predicted protein [Coccidioides posadasii str. Silveira]QVM10270.1 hypothetical protein D8B26_004930 [Coccidioides posadasii str. Silveira]